jgi:CheY-like chemotaxis protein
VNTQSDNVEARNSVLLVDDSSDVRAFFKVFTEIHDIPLITAKDGLEALEKLKALSFDPAVLFVDLNMPNMNGTEFIEKLRERGLASSSHVVICSGAERDSIPQIDSSTEWLQKPFELSELLRIIIEAQHH